MSIIAIVGTALAITMIMTIIVTEEIKNVSIAPESNRYRTFYLDGFSQKDSTSSSSYDGSIRYEIIHDYLNELKTPELVSIYYSYPQSMAITFSAGTEEPSWLATRSTDAAYWKGLSFKVLEGRVYTQEEFESGISYAVISETKAKELFKGENSIGKTLYIKKKEYTVIGVIKDVSPLFKQAYAELWIPYTSVQNYQDEAYVMALLAKSPNDYPAIYAEIRDIERKYKHQKDSSTIAIRGPHNHRVYTSKVNGFSAEEVKQSISIMNRKRMLIFLILLLIPALNLSGISLSRIKKRTSEIGVRKAFGAKKYVILIQVLFENLITSLIGGILGLCFSYIIVINLKEWLLKLSVDEGIPLNALVSPGIFVGVFIVCLLVNLLSAGLPAYKASRYTIVNSINQNDKQS